MSTLNSPADIHCQYVSGTGSCRSAPSNRTKLMSASRKARPTTVGPTIVGTSLRAGATKAAVPLTMNPSRGSRAMAQRNVGSNSCTLPAQQAEAAHVDRLEVTEYGD